MQFQLRTLLIVVASVAVAAAALAPWFRSLDALTQMRMAVIFGSIALENLAFIGLIAWCDRAYRRDFGPCWTSAPMIVDRFHIMTIVWSFLTVVMCWVIAQNIERETAHGANNYALFHDCSSQIGMVLWTGPMVVINHLLMRIRFCENGISAGRFIPWRSIQSWHWQNDKLVVQATPTFRLENRIPAAAKDAVNAIMLRETARHAKSNEPFKFQFNRQMLLAFPLLLVAFFMTLFPLIAPRPIPTPPPVPPRPIILPPAATPPEPRPASPPPWRRPAAPVPSNQVAATTNLE